MLDFPIFAGIIASILHVISGPDHLAAITPFAIDARQKVWKIGFLWGLGHLSGMLLIGLLFLVFKESIPFEQISEHSEQIVGVVLIALGFWVLYSFYWRKETHLSTDTQHGEDLLNINEQANSELLDSYANEKNFNKHWSSFGIGVLHGFAGIAHFVLLLPVLGFENQMDSVQYIIGFGLGTVLAMTIYTFLLGRVSTISRRQNSSSIFQTIRFSGGIFAITIGVYWLYLSL